MKSPMPGVDINSSGGSTDIMSVRSGSSVVIDAGATLTVAAGATLSVSGYVASAIDSLKIGVGEGTITDAVATLTLTETNIALVGATVVTGSLGVSTTFTSGTADHFAIDANGIITLNTSGGTPNVINAHGTPGTILISGGPVQITGDGTTPDLILHGAGSLATEGRTVSGTHVVDTGTFAFCVDQKSMRINIEGTVYQIPLWADT